MKRIEFIAPVEAMRGNLSGKQEGLLYPAANNRAYESPLGSVNYAKNYRPSFVGAKRAKDGLKYFAVRTKSAIHLTAKSKRQMAILGGAGACYAAILGNETQRTKVEFAYLYAMNNNLTVGKNGTAVKSLREFLMPMIMISLKRRNAKLFSLQYNTRGDEVAISNPWIEIGDFDTRCNIDAVVLDRFYTELGPVGTFKASLVADGEQYHFYSVSGKTCAQVYTGDTKMMNVFGSDGVGEGALAVQEGTLKVRLGESLSYNNVTLEGTPVSGTDQISADATYEVAAE